ncbi:cellulose biosynthesis protein BcsC [Alloalcanivorax profundimaris]|uniref:cellulose biosynthesis protein BcsC n=1 Tax=Alloalcanivorax profundimaris TaxID=2735259 RepID=UPI001887E8E7|nr:cellulose biosynthesis protein BcsC [Alloalcanivorax profundimaris]MBF1800201.1 tetratricopeptide repeat protein [Alloalcanivorax profundimaris]
MKAKRFNGWLAAGLLGSALLAPVAPVLAQETDASVQRLLDQAEFWRGNNRPDLAADTLQRVLNADPDNPAALYQMAMLEMDRDPAAAQRYADRLRRVAPDSDYARRLAERNRRQGLDSDLLREARRLAAAGNPKGAVARYEELFGDRPPPGDLALEYYQTLAGVDGRRDEARRGLEKLAEARPGDRAVSLALGKVLTYEGATRRQGIERLRGLWENNPDKEVAAAWRQAVLWLPDQPASVAPLRAYLERFPDDNGVKAKLVQANDQATAERGRGYQALDAGRAGSAEKAFRAALKDNPNDADAMAGLGLAQLRREQFADAERSLDRAIKMNPAKAGDWRPALQSARFYGRLASARAAYQAGNLDQAFQAVRPLTEVSGNQGRDAKLLQGDILLAQDRPQVAETLYRGLLVERPALTQARAGLVRALLAQGRYDEADEVFAQLPASAREDLAYLRQQRVDALRTRGEELIAGGRPGAGESALREAMAVAPDDPWTRLSLARFYDDQGQPRRARALIEPLLEGNPSADDLRVVALLAEKQRRWEDAEALLGRIPAGQRDDAIDALADRVRAGARVARLRRVLSEGDSWQVENALDDLYRNPPQDPQELGQVATLLVDQGEEGLALALVRRDLDLHLNESDAVEPFLNHASVLSRTGNQREARRLMALLDRRAADNRQARVALGNTRDQLLLDQVVALRDDGELAQAYDVLVAELERRPQEPALLHELGSLYLEGKRYQDARRVFEWQLERDPNDLVARRGAVASALGAGDADRAEELLRQVAPLEDGELLLLAARTAEAQGDKRQALKFAEQAENAERGDSPVIAGVVNPFRGAGQSRDDGRWAAFGGGGDDDKGAGVWLPGQTETAGRWQPDGEARAYLNRSYDSGPVTPTPASPYQGGRDEQWAGDWRRPDEVARMGDYRSGGGGTSARAAARQAAPTPPPSRERLVRIDDLQGDLRRALSPKGQGGLSLRFRDGESGLSELTEVRGDIGLSGVPFGGGRFTATASPVYLNAGTLSEDGGRRFGSTGATSAAAEAVVEQLSGVGDLIDEIDEFADQVDATQGAFDTAEAQRDAAQTSVTTAQANLADAQQDLLDAEDPTDEELAALEAAVDTRQTQLNQAEETFNQRQNQLDQAENALANAEDVFDTNVDRNVLFESGIDLDALNADQRQFVNEYLEREFGSSDFSLAADNVADYRARSAAVRQLVNDVAARAGAYQRAAASGNQTDSGLAVAFGYQEGSFGADIGSTPYGFEVTNLVGGVTWAPEVAPNTRFRVTAQRRAVKDSLLSYAGVEDPATGDRWGGVTRTGAELGLAFDNGDVGTYGDLGFYSYQGHNVDDNQEASFNLGAYVKPINQRWRELQTGVHLNYRSFDENRGQFTYGHGGYFSPQDYVSLAFPITYQESYNKVTWNARVSPGFQSYSVEEAPYFPTLRGQQQWLDILADAGVAPASYYEAESESGFGLNLGAGLDYQLSPAFSLGTSLGYDTFGDYSETSAMINLLYTMEP